MVRFEQLLIFFVAQQRIVREECQLIVVNRIDKIVADDFVGAGVAFPAPGFVGGIVPFAVGGLEIDADFDDRAGGEAGDAADFFQVDDGLHSAAGVLAGLGFGGDFGAKRLGG